MAYKAIAIFADGHHASEDLVIAADGIRSGLCTTVLGEEVPPQYGGYVNWNGLVTASPDLAPPETWVIYVGNHQRVSMMPVAGDRLYFFFDVPLPKGFNPPDVSVQTELSEYFAGWAAPVQTLIGQIDPEQTNRLEIHDVGPLERMVRGRIAPSIIDTPTNRQAMGSEQADQWVKPESLAEVICFLASEAAKDIRGAAIPVYGSV